MTDHIIKAAKAAGGTTYTNRHFPGEIACAFGPEALARFYSIVRAEALEDAARVVEARRAYESSAAAHHAGNWQPAFEFHTTRHAAMVDALDSIRALKDKDHG